MGARTSPSATCAAAGETPALRRASQGAFLADAYEEAGFIPSWRHASTLAQRRDMFARIAELRVEQAQLADASPATLIAALLRIAKASEAVGAPAGVKEVRLTLMEASRLSAALALVRKQERHSKEWDLGGP